MMLVLIPQTGKWLTIQPFIELLEIPVGCSASQVSLDCSIVCLVYQPLFLNLYHQKAVESTLWPTIQVVQEEYCWCQYPHLGHYTAYWLPAGPGGADHSSVLPNLVVFSSPHCLLIQTLVHQIFFMRTFQENL